MNIIDIIIRAKDMASDVMDRVGESTKKLKGYLEDSVQASMAFARGMAVAGAGVAAFIGYGAHIAGDLEAARQGFITLLGSAEAADKTIALVKRDAAATPFELPGLIKANQLLTSVTHDGVKSEAILLDVGKALAAMGKGQPELDRIIVNLQQISAVGHASAIDIKQFAYAGINIYDLLAQSTGKTKEAIQDMVSSGAVTFDMLTEAFAKAGGAGGQFADAFKNQAGTFNQLWSNMKDSVAIAAADIVTNTGIFDVLKKAISGIVDFLTEHKDDIVAGIKDFIKLIKDNGVIVAGIITGALTPAIGGLIFKIIKMITTLSPWMIGMTAVVVIVKKVIDHFGGMKKTMEAAKRLWDGWSPVIIAVGAALATVAAIMVVQWLAGVWAVIAANVALAASWIAAFWPVIAIIAGIALVVALVVKYWDNIKQAFIVAWNAIKSAAAAVWDWLKSSAKAIANFFSGIWTGIKNVALGVWKNITHAFSNAVDFITAAFNMVKDVVMGVFNAIKTIVMTVMKVIYYGYIKPQIDIISTAFMVIYNVVYWIFTLIRGIIILAMQAIWLIIKTVIDFVVAGFIWLKDGIIAVWNWIVQAATTAWNWLWSNVIKPVVDFIIGYITTMQLIITTIWQAIVDAATLAWNWLWTNIIKPVVDFITGAFNTVKTAISGAWDWITSTASSAWSKVTGFFTGAIDKIKSGFTGAVDWIKEKFNSIVTAAQSIGTTISSALSGAWEGLKTGLKNALNWIIEKINGLIGGANKIVKWIPGVDEIPKIPKLARGELNFAGGMVDVNEIGRETVILPKGSNVRSADDTKMMGSGNNGGNTFTGNIYLGDAGAVREFMRYLDRDGELVAMGIPT